MVWFCWIQVFLRCSDVPKREPWFYQNHQRNQKVTLTAWRGLIQKRNLQEENVYGTFCRKPEGNLLENL